jgi:hypothetical protein
VSLITDALGLRRSKSAAVAAQETLPPFRSRNLGMQVVALLVMIAGLTVVAVWQGPVILTWLETLAGFSPVGVKPAPVAVIRPEPAPVAAAGEKPAAVPAPTPGLAETARSPTALIRTREGESPDGLFQAVEVPFAPSVKDEDPGKAAEKKKNELAAAVRALQIQGVRLQGNDSRALINGNPVAVGESVGDEGLKLKTVEASRLIFADGFGNEYPRSY